MARGVIEAQEWRWVTIAGGLLLVMLSIPLLWAYAAAVPDRVFMGILVNPLDGMSYQAKMIQGYQGSWLFHLPYTPEPHHGVFLFTFYLGLGHLARLLGLQPILVFHAVRLVGGMFMFIALYRFVSDWTDSVAQRQITWLLAVVGTGFGWMALLFGHATPDMLILPEAFPLQAVYANAHFPWAIAIAVTIAHLLVSAALDETLTYPDLDLKTLALVTGVILLVSISPFMLVPLGAGYAALCAWRAWEKRRLPQRELTWGGLLLTFALPLALYNGWAISPINPIFQGWMEQNLTPSPPVWDYLIAFGPLLVLAGCGVWGSRKHFQASDAFLSGWIVATFACLYLPIGLQRRFAMGVVVPLAIYAGTGLWRVIAPKVQDRWRFALTLLAFLTFAPTTILAIVLPMYGTLDRESGFSYYISRAENESLIWLGQHAGPQDVVLASPEFSLFIPTVGPRVVYGHPFETLNAEARRSEVLDYYTGQSCGVIGAEGVDYVVFGPRERNLAPPGVACPAPGDPVFASSDGEVLIYAAANGQ